MKELKAGTKVKTAQAYDCCINDLKAGQKLPEESFNVGKGQLGEIAYRSKKTEDEGTEYGYPEKSKAYMVLFSEGLGTILFDNEFKVVAKKKAKKGKK